MPSSRIHAGSPLVSESARFHSKFLACTLTTVLQRSSADVICSEVLASASGQRALDGCPRSDSMVTCLLRAGDSETLIDSADSNGEDALPAGSRRSAWPSIANTRKARRAGSCWLQMLQASGPRQNLIATAMCHVGNSPLAFRRQALKPCMIVSFVCLQPAPSESKQSQHIAPQILWQLSDGTLASGPD